MIFYYRIVASSSHTQKRQHGREMEREERKPFSHKIISLPLCVSSYMRTSVFAIHSDGSLNDIINISSFFAAAAACASPASPKMLREKAKKKPLTFLCLFRCWGNHELSKRVKSPPCKYEEILKFFFLANSQLSAK